MTQPHEDIDSSKFKVGQKVRLKPLDELKKIGSRQNIMVEANFIYSPLELTVAKVIVVKEVRATGHYFMFRLSNYKELSRNNYWYHEDFLQPIRQLPDHLKGKL